MIKKFTKKLYGIKRIDSYKTVYYDNYNDSQKYMKMFPQFIDNIFILEYLGEYAERKDVIRKIYTNQKPIVLSVLDEEGYEIYNDTKSKPKEKNYIWEYTTGDLKEEYNALENFGVEMEENIYQNKSLK